MTLIGKTLGLLLGMSFMGILGYGGYLAVRTTATLFARLDSDVAIVTGIGCVVALTSAWLIARGIGAARRDDKAMTLREERTATYQLLLDFWSNRLRQAPAQADPLPPELAGRLQVLERLLAMYGAGAVVEAHARLRRLEREKGCQHADVHARLGDLVMTVRSDLGTDTPPNLAHTLERLLVPASA